MSEERGKIGEDAFLKSITGEMVPTLDADGKQIPKLEGLYFKPIDAEESIQIAELCAKHGKDFGFAFTLATALRYADGTRVVESEEGAKRLKHALGGIIQDAMLVIRRISGRGGDDGEDDEKKTTSTPKTT